MQSAALLLVLLVVGVALALPADPMMMMMMKPAADMQPMARAADLMPMARAAGMDMARGAGMDKKTDQADTKKAVAGGMNKMGDRTASEMSGAERKSSDDPSSSENKKYFPCDVGKVWFRKECVSTITWSNGNTYYYGR
ncbi:Hypothetical predicted protein [Cloeon dipterum]|uniref:Uncharacterized protein n=1 Tax=Cloeon dipterum TaxID=197152 RepID=A0A8S1C0D8_9INSE|nr:Hypothetical predicted protein [Cloeon dipterum]